MTLIVEDGTGLANAQSYNAAADVGTYLTARGLDAPWVALSSTEKDIACVLATDWLENLKRLVWRGARLTAGQALSFPRIDVVDDDGFTLSAAPLPLRLRNAHAELCGILASRKASRGLTPQSLQPIRARGGKILSQSVAGMSQTFAADAPVEDELVSVIGMLAPLLTEDSSRFAHPSFVYNTDDLTVFDPD